VTWPATPPIALVAAFLAAGLAACGSRREVSGTPTVQGAPRGPGSADTNPKVGTLAHLAHTALPDAGAVMASDLDGDQPLLGEERERDPRSDTVKIKVVIDARRQAHVFWGRKDYGPAPLEIERPRDSGPVDLVVVAPGFLPHHARAFTDRDDSISLRLYTAAEAPQLLGYRSDAVLAPQARAGAEATAHATSASVPPPTQGLPAKKPEK
jgi:hypothetical protein